MTPVPEIIIFTAEKDYQDNPDAVTKAAVERLGGVPGIQESHHGFQYDDELPAGVKKAVWVNVWDSYESAEKQGDQLNALFSESDKAEIIHVKIGSDLAKPISAPTTEIAWMTLKPGQSVEALAQFIDELQLLLRKNSGCWDSAWGPTVEDKNVYVGILGWDTKEAHTVAVAKGTEAFEIIEKAREIADIKLLHADLTKFSA